MGTLHILGRLGRDPDLRLTPDGTPVVNFSVAEDRKWKDSDGTEHKKIWWWHCTAWNKAAETIAHYFTKGKGIYIEGEIQSDDKGNPRLYQRQDGSYGSSFEVTVKVFQFVPSSGTNGDEPPSEGEQPNGDSANSDVPSGRPVTEIPF